MSRTITFKGVELQNPLTLAESEREKQHYLNVQIYFGPALESVAPKRVQEISSELRKEYPKGLVII
jgi:hypothetical protein